MRIVTANLVRRPLPAFTTVLFLLSGCGGAGFAPSPQWGQWAQRAGGIADGPEQARAQVALARLALGVKPGMTVHVLANDRFGAWAFVDGSMFVTRRLIRALSDDELAAVLAHEAGHLRCAGRIEPGAALDGAAALPDAESRADDAGRLILRSHGIPEGALASALEKVRDAGGISPMLRAALDARVRRLTLVTAHEPPGRELLAGVPTGVAQNGP